MVFNVVSPEESKTCGKLRFTKPTQKEIDEADKEIVFYGYVFDRNIVWIYNVLR